MKRFFFYFLLGIGISTMGVAQDSKPPLDYSVYDNWKSVSSSQLSKTGKFISYEINPSVGDGVLRFQEIDGSKVVMVERGDGAQFSPAEDFIAFRIKVFADTLRQAKLDKVKKDKMPMDSLGIYLMETQRTLTFAQLKSFKVPAEGVGVIAYQLKPLPEPKDTTKTDDDAAGEEKKEKKKKEKKKEFGGETLYVQHPITGKSIEIEDVSDYQFSQKGSALRVLRIVEDSVNTSEIILVNPESLEKRSLWKKEGISKKISTTKNMDQLVFLHSTDTSKIKVYQLYHWTNKMDEPRLLVDSLTEGMPEGFTVSENANFGFSEDGQLLTLGTAEIPKIEQEETDSLLSEDRVQLDIWHWQEPVLQSMQLKRTAQAKKTNYQALYNLEKDYFLQLGKEDFVTRYSIPVYGKKKTALGSNTHPYELENSVNFTSLKDVYLKDLKTGEDEMIFEGVTFSPRLSPYGRYLTWWEPQDSNYYSYHIAKKKMVRLTENMEVSFAIDDNDYPQDTRSYGSMGWSDDDEAFYVYDKFDIWRFDPSGELKPKNLSNSYGRENNLRFRYSKIDREEKFIQEDQDYYFNTFNYENKESGIYQIRLDEGNTKKMHFGQFSIGGLSKAKEGEILIWTQGNVQNYPNLHSSDLAFKQIETISDANPQQDDYNWMNVELVDWLDYNGIKHQGLLYKPENFDASKKYPMMVYFYRTHSQDMYKHISPRASYSTINAAFYASNGYLVFMPDVLFEIGHPGKSAFNSIVSGVMSLGKERSYINMEKLGIQGQSWGGYQAAYIITQTDLFAAASPGAPVSNMTSAYGGIRTSSGMCRQVQYEQGQSRIGGTLWDKPLEYYENSPLFYANKCTTPCLIRHNDNDGAVPFAQGVEFFVALRRLGRPAWLLNYNKGPHNLTAKLSNRKDLSVRMKQFFDHYMMDQEAPEWLSEGVKAVDKKKNETFYLDYMK